MMTKSPKLARVFERARRIAPTPLPVLVTGPTGTGKELIARALHSLSNAAGPFVTVNCGALSATLVEAELFGYVRGAFTGADADRVGLFEAAAGGTLFLDEIGELPLALQPRLLRVLEAGAVRRVGDALERSVSVRVVAATHRDLDRMAEASLFREDLLHRLRILSIELPALADRREDIPLLARHFLAKDAPPLSPEAMKRLMLHPWPGNVRELKNAIVRASLLAQGPLIRAEDLELSESRGRIGDLSAEEQRDLLLETLRVCENNRSRAARRLGIARSTLHERLRKLSVA